MNHHVRASAPYERRPPSPPTIAIPAVLPLRRKGNKGEMVLTPAYENVDPESLSPEDLAIITGNVARIAGVEAASNWRYEQRRQAQPVLEFLYLGPNPIIRDIEFLRQEGITMIINVRECQLASRPLQSMENATEKLGIEGRYVDINDNQGLIAGFADIVRSINNHLLRVYHLQCQEKTEDGQMVLDPTTFRRGKVLVTCQTGNDIAPVIAAAYIMAVLGKDMADTVQFICALRFCSVFDENRKRLLMSWESILRARAQVSRSRSMEPPPLLTGKTKRGFGDVAMDEDEDDDATDRDRFMGREAFVPFADVDG